VDVNRKLTLKDIDYPVVDGLGCGHMITMSAGGCVFDGFEVTNSAEDCAGIYVRSEDNVIKNDVVNSHEDYGIYLDHSNFINNDGGNVHSYGSNIWSSREKITYVYKGSTHKNYMGNYWDDYEGSDADNDEYPLMNSFEHYF